MEEAMLASVAEAEEVRSEALGAEATEPGQRDRPSPHLAVQSEVPCGHGRDAAPDVAGPAPIPVKAT
eukprot:13329918-Alexandrium_andersonii.AAC.1